MNDEVSHDVTRALAALQGRQPEAKDRLYALVYAELRRLAASRMERERASHTLQPTALVHEACLRLLGAGAGHWENRAHFFGAAAEAMRRILVDYARAKRAKKRGGERAKVCLDEATEVSEETADEVLAVHEALTKLTAVDPDKARIVELRFFAGLTVEETAEVLSVSPRTIKRGWSYAKAWLYREINDT